MDPRSSRESLESIVKEAARSQQRAAVRSSAENPKVSKQAAQKKKAMLGRGYLIGAGVVLVAAVVVTILGLRVSEEGRDEANAAKPDPAKIEAVATASRIQAAPLMKVVMAKDLPPEAHAPEDLYSAKHREEAIEKLVEEGVAIFEPLNVLKFDGKPMHFHVLLHRPLEAEIDQLWTEKGLLAMEPEIENIWLRRVVISSSQQLSVLQNTEAVDRITYDKLKRDKMRDLTNEALSRETAKEAPKEPTPQ